jgi:hypothetical protein
MHGIVVPRDKTVTRCRADLSRRQVPVGHLGVLVHELGHGCVRFRLASRRGLLKQLPQLDLRRPFGLAGLPQPNLPARQRIGPSVDLKPKFPLISL